MFIMCQDVPVMRIDLDEGVYKILHPELVPYQLRGAITPLNELNLEGMSIKAIEKEIKCREHFRDKNRTAITHYLASRVLNLSRENAKKILNAYHFSQNQDDATRARIAIACKAVSMVDSYWIKLEDSSITWEDLNPRSVSLNQIVAHIALKGSSLTIQGIPHTPELTGQGAYAKCWQRFEDGTYLLKKSSKGGHESDVEVLVSNILDCTNVPHVKYTMTEFDGDKVCKCKNMASDDLGITSAEDIYSYCSRNELNFIDFLLNLDSENVMKMCIVDYLISNSDRHMQNFGCYFSSYTGELVSMHPLFDHNNAFDSEFMNDSQGGESLFFLGRSQKEACTYALKHCEFEITDVDQKIFFDHDMYDSFRERCNSVGIKFKPKFISATYDNYYKKLSEFDTQPNEPSSIQHSTVFNDKEI